MALGNPRERPFGGKGTKGILGPTVPLFLTLFAPFHFCLHKVPSQDGLGARTTAVQSTSLPALCLTLT